MHVYDDRRQEEWALDSFAAADMATASRGADSLILRRRDGRELLIPVTAEATLAAVAPVLLQQGLSMSPSAKRFLSDQTRQRRA